VTPPPAGRSDEAGRGENAASGPALRPRLNHGTTKRRARRSSARVLED
jgi:hypothetical protein